MKKLTLDYIAHNAKRVTIEVPDDVNEENLDPYDYFDEVMDALNRGEGDDLDYSDDDELNVVELH